MCAYRRNCCARLREERLERGRGAHGIKGRLAAGPTGGVGVGSIKVSGSPAPLAQLNVTPLIRRHRPPPTPWAAPRARL